MFNLFNCAKILDSLGVKALVGTIQCQEAPHCPGHLYVPEDPGAVHPARLVDGVAPDVEHGLGRADDAADQRTRGHAHPQLEVVEAVLVDVLQLVVQLGREVDQVADVIVGVILELR